MSWTIFHVEEASFLHLVLWTQNSAQDVWRTGTVPVWPIVHQDSFFVLKIQHNTIIGIFWIHIIRSMWLFYPSLLPVISAEFMRCENVALSIFPSFSWNEQIYPLIWKIVVFTSLENPFKLLSISFFVISTYQLQKGIRFSFFTNCPLQSKCLSGLNTWGSGKSFSFQCIGTINPNI